MKTFSIILFAYMCTFSLQAHEYFFGFAEVEYNDISQKFECTVVLSGHDLNKALESDSMKNLNLQDLQEGSLDFRKIEQFICSGFTVSNGRETAKLNLIGIEVMLNGNINIYLESNKIEVDNEIIFKFDLLMDQFPEQQNKINFTNKGISSALIFLKDEKQQIIEIGKI